MFDKNNGSNFAAHKEFNKALRGTCFVSIPYKTWMVVQLFWNLRSLLHFFHSLWQRHVLRVTFYFELMESILVCFILILQVISRKDVSVQDFRYKVRTYRYMNLSVTFTEFHCLKHFLSVSNIKHFMYILNNCCHFLFILCSSWEIELKQRKLQTLTNKLTN